MTTDLAVARPARSLGFPVVGLGASAGGLSALQRFFENMPADNGMAFVVILHLSPKHQSHSVPILQRATRMPVREAVESVPIEPNRVYVIAPTRELSMVDGQLHVAQAVRPRGRHVAIDVFFRTLAEAHRERAVSVVLSGTGSDGAVGMTRIKEEGGVTLVQSPADAEYDDMPRAAIATGMVDIVLPVVDMPQKLVDLWGNARHIELPATDGDRPRTDFPPSAEAEGQAEKALDSIMKSLRERTGHDFRHYKRATVLRRIERRLQVVGLPTLPTYAAHLVAHPEETDALLQDMLISVTNFFRDRDAFDALEREIAVSLVDAKPGREQYRAWVAGGATGEEAYSVAILLAEGAALERVRPAIQVFASDIDERAIAVARAGCYPLAITTDVTPRRLREFFTRESGQYRVVKAVRDTTLFAVHNLLRDPPFSRLDLVCCRNLLIYLDRDAQQQVLQILHFALRPGGVLFLGSSESADAAADLFTVIDKKHRLYRANALARGVRRLPDLPVTDVTVPVPGLAPAAAGDRPALAQLHRRLLESHATASVLIDEQATILHLSQKATRYLRYAGGTPSHNLLTVIRDDVRPELRTALALAWETGRSVEARKVRIRHEGHASTLGMMAFPTRDPVSGSTFMLVLFTEAEASLALDAEAALAARDPMLVALEKELQSTHEMLQGSLGQSEASHHELKAANEELQAINEELRSATEELETSKEELQSVNEELATVNFELKERVEETAQINDDLSNLIASTDIGNIFVDANLRIKRFTPRAADVFNIIEGDVGRSLLDITHRLEYAQLRADADEAFRTLQLVEREVAGPQGRRYLVRVLPYRTREDRIDGAVLTFVDVSAVRRAEQRAREGEMQLQLAAASTRDYAIIALDARGAVTSWNRGAEAIFGYTAEEMTGESASVLWTPEDVAVGEFEADLRRAREVGRADDERWQVCKDGSRLFCRGITTPLHDGGFIGYARIARDVTQDRLEQTRRDEQLQSEQQLRSQLQEASALKDEFLAVMSHELKHPLNLIHVNAELLNRMPEVRDSPGVARAAQVIRRTVLSQAKIIDDLLDLSRLHTGKLSLNFAAIEWIGIIERVVEAVRGDAAAKRLTLRTELDPLASPVFADGLRVEQIIWNLLSNALKFTPEGGSVTIGLHVDDGMGRFEVADTGQGIEPSFLPHVFDMFRQADSRTTRQEGGLGIGLALVKHLAELQGGRVAALSEGRGRGARFSVWLPRSGFQPSDGMPTTELPALAGLRILLVDDSVDALDSFGTLLELEGARVTAAHSGADALAAAEKADFDLILSDVGMPLMDGYQLIAELRRRPRTAEVPAVALTGYGRPQNERRALEAGFDAHLAKPVGLDALLQTVPRLRRKADRGASR